MSAYNPPWCGNMSILPRGGLVDRCLRYLLTQQPGAQVYNLDEGVKVEEAKGGVASKILILDAFTDTNGTALGGHTIAPTNVPDTSWTSNLGAWQISGNKAVATATGNENIATLGAGIADIQASVRASITADGSGANRDTGLVCRYASSGFWKISINRADSTFRIVEVQLTPSVSRTVRASSAATITAGVEYLITATLSAASISATLSGGDLGAPITITYGSATRNQAITTHGICTRTATTPSTTLDSFEVDSL